MKLTQIILSLLLISGLNANEEPVLRDPTQAKNTLVDAIRKARIIKTSPRKEKTAPKKVVKKPLPEIPMLKIKGRMLSNIKGKKSSVTLEVDGKNYFIREGGEIVYQLDKPSGTKGIEQIKITVKEIKKKRVIVELWPHNTLLTLE